jgi:hypothetical protein
MGMVEAAINDSLVVEGLLVFIQSVIQNLPYRFNRKFKKNGQSETG